MKKIKDKLEKLDAKREILLKELEEAKANLDFSCGCGATHKIKDCGVLQTHWYTRPYSCSEGDYWNEGELQIVCPDTGNRNRVLSDTDRIVQKFKAQYKDKFKSVKDTYGDDVLDTPWWNNYSVQENPEYYGL